MCEIVHGIRLAPAPTGLLACGCWCESGAMRVFRPNVKEQKQFLRAGFRSARPRWILESSKLRARRRVSRSKTYTTHDAWCTRPSPACARARGRALLERPPDAPAPQPEGGLRGLSLPCILITPCHATHVSDLGAVGVKPYDGKGSFSAMRVRRPLAPSRSAWLCLPAPCRCWTRNMSHECSRV